MGFIGFQLDVMRFIFIVIVGISLVIFVMFYKSFYSKHSPRKVSKFDQVKLLYSSRAERIKLTNKLSPPKMKSREKLPEKKLLKILIQLPKYNSDSSNDSSQIYTPSINIFCETSKNTHKKRRIFKSNIEKIYSNKPKFTAPFRRLSAGISK